MISITGTAVYSFKVGGSEALDKQADYSRTARRVVFIQAAQREVQRGQLHPSNETCLAFQCDLTLNQSNRPHMPSLTHNLQFLRPPGGLVSRWGSVAKKLFERYDNKTTSARVSAQCGTWTQASCKNITWLEETWVWQEACCAIVRWNALHNWCWGARTCLSSAYAIHLLPRGNTAKEMKFKQTTNEAFTLSQWGGAAQQWKWNMGKKEKLLIRTHTCQPSGLFGLRSRFTFLLAGQANVSRIFSCWLLSVFHSANHCSRAKTKDVTHFSLVSRVVFHLVRPKIAVWSWHTSKIFGLWYIDLYWM